MSRRSISPSDAPLQSPLNAGAAAGSSPARRGRRSTSPSSCGAGPAPPPPTHRSRRGAGCCRGRSRAQRRPSAWICSRLQISRRSRCPPRRVHRPPRAQQLHRRARRGCRTPPCHHRWGCVAPPPPRLAARHLNPPCQAGLEHKRYLIVTYRSEFDRVHYPLPLEYEASPPLPCRWWACAAGSPAGRGRRSQRSCSGSSGACDPSWPSRWRRPAPPCAPPPPERPPAPADAPAPGQTAACSQMGAELRARCAQETQQSAQLREENAELQRALATAAAAAAPGDGGEAAATELDLLRKIVAKCTPSLHPRPESAPTVPPPPRLEQDLLSERTKFQRALQKKADSCSELTREVEALRESERSLQIRCRALTAESAMRKRPVPRKAPQRRSASLERRALSVGAPRRPHPLANRPWRPGLGGLGREAAAAPLGITGATLAVGLRRQSARGVGRAALARRTPAGATAFARLLAVAVAGALRPHGVRQSAGGEASGGTNGPRCGAPPHHAIAQRLARHKRPGAFAGHTGAQHRRWHPRGARRLGQPRRARQKGWHSGAHGTAGRRRGRPAPSIATQEHAGAWRVLSAVGRDERHRRPAKRPPRLPEVRARNTGVDFSHHHGPFLDCGGAASGAARPFGAAAAHPMALPIRGQQSRGVGGGQRGSKLLPCARGAAPDGSPLPRLGVAAGDSGCGSCSVPRQSGPAHPPGSGRQAGVPRGCGGGGGRGGAVQRGRARARGGWTR